MEPQHILVLEAQNIKNLKAVRLEPNGETVTVGGDNGAGKSALFDVIQYGFGGGHEIPDEPVRKGQDEGRILLETEDLVVRRILRREGSDRLVVENKEGARFSSPQTMLNELQSALSFDPLRFKQASSREQVETLKGLVDFDFESLEENRQEAYKKRREVGREKKQLKGQLEGIEFHEDAPDEEKSAKELTAELREVREHNDEINRLEDTIDEAEESVSNIETELDEVEAEIKRLKEKRQRLFKDLDNQEVKAKNLRQKLHDMERRDPTPIEEQIDNIQEVNAKVRENEKYAEVSKHVDRTEGKYAELTNRIDTLDHRKQQAIQQADLPVDGFTFEDDTVLYEGVPFEQISQGEAIRVSVAMGLALNPDLRVLLVRDASLLDRDNLSTIRDMAAEHDAQVWLERVGEGSEVQVVIEDGQVRETRETPETLFG